ncbi:MAG: universal stress protein [Acidimicrobiia bacterium]|nr:universal stress protein [Acidimicrobiia bacterium]
MSGEVLVCVDESAISHAAVAAGLARLDPSLELMLVTVIEGADPMLVTGTGMAGGSMTMDEFRQLEDDRLAAAKDHLTEAAEAIGLVDARIMVLEGQPGPAICHFAETEQAAAIVIGSRGRTGVKRFVLGSVSDHVVRHAPCPVVVTGAEVELD